MMLKLVKTILALVLSASLMGSCGNPCQKLAKKTCKLKGAKSNACKNAKEQVDKFTSSEQKKQCKIGLELLEAMEEQKK